MDEISLSLDLTVLDYRQIIPDTKSSPSVYGHVIDPSANKTILSYLTHVLTVYHIIYCIILLKCEA